MKKNSGWKPNAESWKVRYQGSTLLAKQNTNKKGSCPNYSGVSLFHLGLKSVPVSS